MNYLGFNIQAMLHYIRSFYKHVKLEAAGDYEWVMELETINGEKVVYRGPLTTVVIDAFKPYVEHAKAKRKRICKLIGKIGE